MNRIQSLFMVVVFVLAAMSISVAQTSVGTPAHGTFGGGPFDTVNLGNLNVHFAIPIVQKKGRGVDVDYELTYDNSFWYPTTVSGTKIWQPTSTSFGWSISSPVSTGPISVTNMTGHFDSGKAVSSGSIAYNNGTTAYTCYYTVYSLYNWIDQNNTPHPVSGYTTVSSTCPSGVGPSGSSATSYLIPDISARYVPAVGGILQANGNMSYLGSVTSSYMDTNGNKITSTSAGVITDTLGKTALTATATVSPYTIVYSYTNPSGGTSSYKVTYTSKSVKTKFGCSGISEYSTSAYLVSSITLPDKRAYTFTYEETPGDTNGAVTGRIAEVSLPSGGFIEYAYSGGSGSGGVTCSDGTAAVMTRTVNPGGAWTYTHSYVSADSTSSTSQWTTSVVDPNSNETDYAFVENSSNNFYEESKKVYSGSSSGTLLRTVASQYCPYSSTSAGYSCASTAYPQASSQTIRTVTLPTGQQSETATTYDSNSNVTDVKEYDFGSSGIGTLLRDTQVTYATLTGIYDRPSSVVVYDASSAIVSKTTYLYNGSSVIATSGTPNHSTPYGNRGNVTSVTSYSSSGAYQTKTYSYYDTGNIYQATDVNGAVTTYTYGGCSNSFPTIVTMPTPSSGASLSTGATWDCTGGVQLTSTDVNGLTTTTAYADSNYWRATEVTGASGGVTSYSYPSSSSNESTVTLTFNGQSIENSQLYDGFGRTIETDSQNGSSSYTSVTTAYDEVGNIVSTSIPHDSTTTTELATKTTYDALGRPLTVTDSGAGTTTYTYTGNDVLIDVAAPSGENDKVRQLEYDSLGRLTSVCEVTSSTSYRSTVGACAQTSAKTGYLTKYSYDAVNRLITALQNAQNSSSQQTRTVTYDWLGRTKQESIPETGSSYFTYDSDSAGTCSGSSTGDLIKKVDAIGNTTCYAYDSLHRLLTAKVVSGSYASVTPDIYYVYDAATVNGKAMNEVAGDMAEAYTCAHGSSTGCTKLTDVGFSATVGSNGSATKVLYEKTPNSGGYYVSSDTYYGNGALASVSATRGSSAVGIPSITYTIDGAGRLNSAHDSTNSLDLVTATSFNVASQPMTVTYGNSGDTDAFTYDDASGTGTYRPLTFVYNVAASSSSAAFSNTGTLKWNSNGTLASFSFDDKNDTSKSQECSYSSDDLNRLSSVNCSAAWAQTFNYDAFGNIFKTAPAGTNYLPSGYSAVSNQVTSGVTARYDYNGNMLTDVTVSGDASYGWSARGNPVTVNNGTAYTATYDALGRVVEIGSGSSFQQIVYRPSGDKLAIMSGGSTLVKATIDLPGGGTAVYNASGFAYFRHKDWLGSSRLATKWDHSIYSKEAYAPFGEAETRYESDTYDRSFTGEDEDTMSGLYTFLYRHYNPVSGRWISPDPAGWGVVHEDDPQTLNRYAYVKNQPMIYIDPDGQSDCRDGFQYCQPAQEFSASYSGTYYGPANTGVPTGTSSNPYANFSSPAVYVPGLEITIAESIIKLMGGLKQYEDNVTSMWYSNYMCNNTAAGYGGWSGGYKCSVDVKQSTDYVKSVKGVSVGIWSVESSQAYYNLSEPSALPPPIKDPHKSIVVQQCISELLNAGVSSQNAWSICNKTIK